MENPSAAKARVNAGAGAAQLKLRPFKASYQADGVEGHFEGGGSSDGVKPIPFRAGQTNFSKVVRYPIERRAKSAFQRCASSD